MTTIRFNRQLSAGETWEIASPGRPTRSVTGPPPSNGGTLTTVGTVTIETNRAEVGGTPYAHAPGGVFFTANATGFESSDPNFAAWKDLHYTWSFDDPGWYTRHDTDDLPWGRYYDVDGTETLVNDGTVPSGASVSFLGNDRNVAYGPWVSHVFPQDVDFGVDGEGAPNEYRDFTVQCEVRAEPSADPLTTVTRTVRIYNPAVVCAGTRTILVHPTADTENPSDPAWEPDTYPGAKLVNDHTTAHNSIAGQTEAGPIRILFASGFTHTLATTGTQTWPGRTDKVTALVYGPYGGGTWDYTGDLLMQATGSADSENALYGCDHAGPYDPRDPDAVARPGDGINLAGAKYKTVWDCSSTGWNLCIRGDVDHTNLGFKNAVIGNTFVGSWSNYGIFAHTNVPNNVGPRYTGFCGVWIKQPYGTVAAQGQDEVGPPVYSDHGPLRCSRAGSPSAFNLVDFRSLNSWSGSIQPCDRWMVGPNSTSTDDDFHYNNRDRCRYEGGRIGQTATDPSPEETPPQFKPVRGLWDKIYHVPYVADDHPFPLLISGVVVRNMVTVLPDMPSLNNIIRTAVTGRVADFDPSTQGNIAAAALDYGVELYGNTCVDLRSYAVSGWTGLHEGSDHFSMWAYFTDENNIWSTPNRAEVGSTDDLDDTVLWEVDYPGWRPSDGAPTYPTDDTYAIPAAEGTAARYAPLATSGAYQTASGKTPIDDFFGLLRSGAPSQGAVEP